MYRVRFSSKFSLGEGITSWDLKNRIPRQKLCMYIVLFPSLNSPFQVKIPRWVDLRILRISPICYRQFRVLNSRFWAFSRGPAGFREVREAGRNHFHVSWYLSVSVVTSHGQKPCFPSSKPILFRKSVPYICLCFLTEFLLIGLLGYPRSNFNTRELNSREHFSCFLVITRNPPERFWRK